MDLIHLAHERDMWQAFVNCVLNPRVLKNIGNSWVARQLLASQRLHSIELI
jgi:hypothetical protein